MNRKEVLTAPAIGWTIDLGGVEVVAIDYGIEDRIIFRGPCLGRTRAHSARVRYGKQGRPYILVYGRRLYLDQIERTLTAAKMETESKIPAAFPGPDGKELEQWT